MLNIILKISKIKKTSEIWSSAYQNLNTDDLKLCEGYFKNELQQMIKDIEDTLKNDTELTHKYIAQAYSDDLKQRFRDVRLGTTEYSLLHLAAKCNRQNFCTYLIEDIKIDKDFRCKSKSTPIHHLVKSNIINKKDYILDVSLASVKNKKLLDKQISFKEAFQVFVKFACDFNSQDENGYSPLHHAVIKNNYAAVLFLLNLLNIDIYIEDKKGLTPLQLSCKLGNEDIAEDLIDKMETNKILNLIMSESSPLHLACRLKSEKYLIVKKLLEKAHFECTQKPNGKELFEKILKKDDQNRQTILHLAVENNHLNIVELLYRDYNIPKDLKDGLNGNLPIHLAAKNGSCEMFNLLQKYDDVSFKSNNNLENALHIASFHNRSKFISEFLKYEKYLIEQSNSININEELKYMPCICVCELDKESYVPCIRAKDSKQNTPLLTALSALNQKCVEQLIEDDLVEVNAVDINGNSIYHICTEHDNAESLKYLFQKTNPQNDISIYGIKNSFDETILHSACRNGNLEMVKLIVNKLYESNSPVDDILYSKNKDGQTCLHIAAEKGYYNIIEYFLKEKKLIQFMDHIDNKSNTSLHLATLYGHSSIVSLLLDHGADANAKNEDNITALDLSCRKGFFEISKNLISNSNLSSQETDNDDYPLHIACNEGAHEVVKLLLFKGAKINQMNKNNQNCLDIAISRSHREVIRVLLDDENWYKLIRTNNLREINENEEEDFKLITHVTNPISVDAKMSSVKANQPLIVESPQLVALFEAKMWDIFKIILDKCQTTETEWNFSIIDPPCKSMSKHPLMLIARSGQENLLKHENTKLLLQLKWRFIPRFAFYFSLIVYLFYLCLFSVYTIELSNIGATLNIHDNRNPIYSQNNFFYRNIRNSNQTISHTQNNQTGDFNMVNNNGQENYFFINRPDSGIYVLLIILILLQLAKELCYIMFLDGFSYFLSYQNVIEIFTYFTSLISLLSRNYYIQSGYGSIAVLFAFFLFPLFIQKLKMFGLYVVAFRRTLTNSAKFFPVFFIMFVGFILSFKIRSNFGVSYSNSTIYSVIRTFTMFVGELDTAKMGLNNDDSIPNFIIYILFIVLMCTIVLNLFVGIAVGEIKTVLDEADIQQTSMRIIFVLKLQAAIQPLCEHIHFLNRILGMNFKIYSYENENRLIKIAYTLYSKTIKLISSKEQRIILSDPQKRLEDSFVEMSRLTSEHIKSIKFGFSNQISDVESKLFNSQRRLQDSLNEFSSNTNQQINSFRDETHKLNSMVKLDLTKVQKVVEESVLNCIRKTSEEFIYTNKYFNTQLAETEKKFLTQIMRLESCLIEMSKKALFQFESMKECCVNESKGLKSIILSSEKLMEVSLTDLEQKQNLVENIIENQFLTKIIGPSNEVIKSLINSVLDKTIERFKTNEINFNIQKLQLESMSLSLKSLFIESIEEIKKTNETEFSCLKTRSSYLDDKLETIETHLKQCNEMINKIALNNSINL